MKLSAAMMLVVFAVTALGLYLSQHNVTANVERDLQQNFQADLSSLHKVQELRHAALAERCRVLVSNSRIHAALEDNALNLLYPSAKDELRDLMESEEPSPEQAAHSLHARFYRFLDGTGAILSPSSPKDVGHLSPEAEAQLALKELPETQQIGYLWEKADAASETVDEVLAVPILCTGTGDLISALVVGFKPFEPAGESGGAGMKSGIWVNGRVYLPTFPASAEAALDTEITDAIAQSDRAQNNFTVRVNGAPQLLFYKRPDQKRHHKIRRVQSLRIFCAEFSATLMIAPG